MTTCALVLGLIRCVIVGPVPSPAEAAAILTPHQFVYVDERPRLPPPQVIVVRTAPVAEPTVPRRLDGTLITSPLWRSVNYGGGWLGRRGSGHYQRFGVTAPPPARRGHVTALPATGR